VARIVGMLNPDGAPCQGLAATLVATKAGATNFFAFDLAANFFAVRFLGHGSGSD